MAWTAPTLRTTAELITASIWNADIVNDLLLLKTPIDNSGNLAPPAATTLTLATDACTPTQNLHKVDTEAAAATDNLSTLTIAGNIRAGHILRLTAANIARVVTVKDSIGNIFLKMGDFVLNAADRWIELMLVGTTWYEQGRSDYNSSTITGPALKGYKESTQTATISAGTLTIDAAVGNHALVSLNANITAITINNVPATGAAFAVVVYYTADGTLRAITHTINTHAVKFPGGVAPAMTATNGKIDKVVYTTTDGGTTWTGDFAGQNY